ncbi:MAG: InlB B-repeat-containing protein [Butyrivibrio sp.]|nr:InlB B-repeat-containing protein [Butyrivibrio sp.]
MSSAIGNGNVINVLGNLTITDNSSEKAGKITGGKNIERGGGVLNLGTLTMTGGTISKNFVNNYGGGVYNLGTLTMTGGTISENSTNNYGAGVYNKGIFEMTGGSITENTASGYGGGVFHCVGQTFKISGTSIIKDNVAKQTTSNVHIQDNNGVAKITIGEGGLSSGASIGVTVYYDNTEFTSGLTKEQAVANMSYFSSDDPKRRVYQGDNGNLVIGSNALVKRKVTYYPNGATGGEAPTDSQSYESGAKVTVRGNGSLEKTGCTFVNWNTKADGAGASYAAGDTFKITSDTELFAQWKHDDTIYKAGDKFSLIDSAFYNLGDGSLTGERINEIFNIQDNKLTIKSVAYNPEKQYVEISFPNTDVKVPIEAVGTSDPVGFAVEGSGTQQEPYTFVAVYDKASVTLTYDGNGNTSGAVPAEAKSYEAGETVTVLDNTGNLVKTDNTFEGWNTKADGTGNAYKAGDTFAISENTTLYAQWKKYDPKAEHKVSFNVQDHGTAPVDQIVKDGDKATKPEDPKADGYTFEGWFKEIECTNAWDFDTAVTSDITLFAKWTEGQPGPAPEPTPTPTDTGVSLNLSETFLTQGMEKALKATKKPEGTPVTWSSSDNSVAYVDGRGIVTGLKTGTAIITATITVDGKEYSASCKVTVVPTGFIPSGSSDGGHTHKFVWVTIEATEDSDGELRYQCETCGEIQTRVPLTAYNVFNKNTTEKIRKAPKDATVRIETNKWIFFHKMVMEALAERKDVTLEISFLDGEYKGNRCTVVIPKGTDTTTLVDKNGFTGFLFLGGKFGMKTN